MNPLEQGQMLIEVFEERKTSLEITLEHFTTLKEVARTEKVKAKYDILIVETQLCLEFIKDRLGVLNKVLSISDKIQNGDLSFTEQLEYMIEVINIMEDM